MTTNDYEVVFAVPMECKSCEDSIEKALKDVNGVNSFDINLKENMVKTKGNFAPSDVVKAIQSIGKDAVIRGTGKPNSAAVCILESFDDKDFKQPVKGLARIISLSDSEVMLDLTLNGLSKGTYYPSIRRSGDISKGALSTGALFHALDPVEVSFPSSIFTTIDSLGASEYSGGLFSGQSFTKAPLKINDLIGRSMILSRLKDEITTDSLCGVIARSAGIWENEKKVCSCSGKTVWQEREESKAKGIKI